MPDFVRNLVKSIGLLALPAELQLAHLFRIGAHRVGGSLSVEEIVLEYDDDRIFIALDDVVAEDRSLITAIDAQVARMRDDDTNWTVDALRVGQGWERLRHLAQEFFIRP